MKQIIAAIVLSVVLVSSISLPAEAGLFNWTSSKSDIAFPIVSRTEKSWSFDTIYVTVTGTNTKSDVALINDNTVLASIPASMKSKQTPTYRKKTFVVEASAYSSTPDQTDDSPFTTASNTQVRDGIIATNFLPFGTVIKIPALYGDKIFVVEDRMNKRYWQTIDIWFADRAVAMKFGRKTVTIEIVSS